MRSIRPSAPPGYEPTDDLTARARIRDAALTRFAADGFGVGVRVIANDAEVSPGLVIHHFGSKDGLRRACDEHVLALIHHLRANAMSSPDPWPSIMTLATDPLYAWLATYLLRSLLAGGDFARRILADLTAETRDNIEGGVATGMIRPSRQPDRRAHLLTRMSLGSLLLDYALLPEPPADLSEWILEITRRDMLVGLEVFTEGLFVDPSFLDSYLAQATAPDGPPDAAPDASPPTATTAVPNPTATPTANAPATTRHPTAEDHLPDESDSEEVDR